MRQLGILTSLVMLAGCSQSDFARFKASYNTGFQNGYAVGFVNSCSGARFKVSAEIDDDGYREGYRDGHEQGVTDCKLEGMG